MRFETFLPCDLLKPFVSSFAIQEGSAETVYKVLPDTRLVIGFQYKGSISLVADDREDLLSPYGITGVADRFRMFKCVPDTGTVLVFFKVAGAAQFFKEPLHEFSGKSISLEHFASQSGLSLLQEQLQEAETDLKRIWLVENFLCSRISFGSQDNLISEALDHIQGRKGIIKMHLLIEKLHISKSPFEKRFRKIVGISPKKFASLVRLKHVLTLYQPGKSLTEIAYEAGYFDQAHFIKQFKIAAGETPEKYFSATHK